MSERMKFEKNIQVYDKTISSQSKTFVIAEAGVNHNGDIEVAKKLIDAAGEAGADAIKFQMFKTENLILHNVEKAPYQKKTTEKNENQYEMLKGLELTKRQNQLLIDYCKEKKIIFLSTPFEKNSLDELEELDVPAFKVSATDLTNIQFLKQVAQKGKPIFLSAGMCYLEEVELALRAISAINPKVVLLQCTSNYPIQNSEANIRVINTFQKKFDMLIGYSDHSQGIGAAPYAVALGAKVIEKHLTLDKNMHGPDHKASITPDELRQLICDIRRVEQYLGDGRKMPSQSEQMTRKSLQKCFVAAKKIKRGDFFTDDNIVAKRTNGEGISALYFDSIVGKRAEKDYEENEIILY